jgi:hypothetical protein
MSDEGQRQPPTYNLITQTSPAGLLPPRPPQDDQDQAYELQLEDDQQEEELEDDQQEEDSRSEGSVEDQDQEENSNVAVGGDQQDQEEERYTVLIRPLIDFQPFLDEFSCSQHPHVHAEHTFFHTINKCEHYCSHLSGGERQSQHPSRPFLFDGYGSHSTTDLNADAWGLIKADQLPSMGGDDGEDPDDSGPDDDDDLCDSDSDDEDDLADLKLQLSDQIRRRNVSRKYRESIMKQLGTLHAIIRVLENYGEQLSQERYTCSLTLREYNQRYHKYLLSVKEMGDKKPKGKKVQSLYEASLTLLSTLCFPTTSNIFVPCHTSQVDGSSNANPDEGILQMSDERT